MVGDFDPEELERCLLRFVGTVAPRPAELCSPMTHVAHQILAPPFDQRHTVWHLQVRGSTGSRTRYRTWHTVWHLKVRDDTTWPWRHEQESNGGGVQI